MTACRGPMRRLLERRLVPIVATVLGITGPATGERPPRPRSIARSSRARPPEAARCTSHLGHILPAPCSASEVKSAKPNEHGKHQKRNAQLKTTTRPHLDERSFPVQACPPSKRRRVRGGVAKPVVKPPLLGA